MPPVLELSERTSLVSHYTEVLFVTFQLGPCMILARSLFLVSGNQEENEATLWAFTASTRGFLEAQALKKGYEWQMAKFHSKRSEERTGAREKRR